MQTLRTNPTAIRFITFLGLLLTAVWLSGCSGCSRSGSHQPRRHQRNTADQPLNTPAQSASRPTPPAPKPTLKQLGTGPTEVAMEKANGVYKVPVTVNGLPMKFILDTGASLISISATEAELMTKQGAISEQDFVGQSKFIDANGDISPGAVVRLRSVQIGDRILENVNASVVSNTKAPLLLGQSALSKFGKISVDYRRNVVTFD